MYTKRIYNNGFIDDAKNQEKCVCIQKVKRSFKEKMGEEIEWEREDDGKNVLRKGIHTIYVLMMARRCGCIV